MPYRKNVYEMVQNKKIRVLKWPGNSPDMNPIENVWEVLKNEIHSQPITTKNELIEQLIKVWFHSKQITNLCKKLIESMPNRIKALKDAKGGQTKY